MFFPRNTFATSDARRPNVHPSASTIDVEVDLYSAVLGGEKVVDTLDGKVKLKIKPETQNGTKVRLKGKGFPVYKKEGQFGDLIVTYSVKIPTNLTDKQKELFRQLQSMN